MPLAVILGLAAAAAVATASSPPAPAAPLHFDKSRFGRSSFGKPTQIACGDRAKLRAKLNALGPKGMTWQEIWCVYNDGAAK